MDVLGVCPLIRISSRINTTYTHVEQIITIYVVEDAGKAPINGQTPRNGAGKSLWDLLRFVITLNETE